LLQWVLPDAIGKALEDIKPVLTGVGKGSSSVGLHWREMDANGETIIGQNRGYSDCCRQQERGYLKRRTLF